MHNVQYTDIDECSAGLHTCGKNANCVDNIGSFTCPCKRGFFKSADGEDCIGIWYDVYFTCHWL